MYSQNDEEKIIIEAVGNENSGHVFDIGAHDGVTNSNSRALIEKGWSATLVEPCHTSFQKLFEEYKNFPEVTLINAAVGLENRLVQFYPDPAEDFQLASTKELGGVGSYWVPQVTVSKIVEQVGGGANVLSIDTEGSSFDILTSCPIDSWGCIAIVVEHDNRIVEISGWAKERGYSVAGVNAENVILKR